jgi:cytochrome c-type biogenesis protein CcmH
MGRDVRGIVTWAITGILAVVVLVGFVRGDPTPADRVARLGSAIKCPVCQGEAIIDSPSPTAQAMVEVLEEKVAAGESDGQIVDYFKTRFGDGIYLDPPFSGTTLLVWLLPLFAVVGGVWMILSRRRTPGNEPVEAETS